MYKITCDGYTLYDGHKNPELIVSDPKLNLAVNSVGSASFTIRQDHPYYDKMKYLSSSFEISDEIGVLFRGRMTNNSYDFYNSKAVDLEGAMAFFNDSIVKPFDFPADYEGDSGYINAYENGNVVSFFLSLLIDNHNSQVASFQRLKLGNVTVSDPNNYITRSSEKYDSTWNILKSKLFDSSLGGYLCIRYESTGNYIDYLSGFELTNSQEIVFAENLLDLKNQFDASETYTAMIPIGATVEEEVVDETTGESVRLKKTITIDDLPNGTIGDDIFKTKDTIYSKSAFSKYGWIYAPVSESTWEDVTEPTNLLNKAIDKLTGKGSLLSNTLEFSAVDLHFTDAQIQSFRIYRNVRVVSEPHGQDEIYPLTKLQLDLFNPQNTKITVGQTNLTMTEGAYKSNSDFVDRIETAEKNIEENLSQITNISNTVITQYTKILNDCNSIILSALESYVETGDYTEFKETVESELKILSDKISLNFETTTSEIENVNGDLQQTLERLSKYFEFSVDGLTIKSGNPNAMQILIDNDIIKFTKNGQQFGWWDGVNFHTGNIIVDVSEKAQFGNFAFVPRSDGSLSFLKVGG